MKNQISILLLLAAACVSRISAAQVKPPLTDQDIIQMASNGLADSVVIGSISANGTNFDVSPNALLALKQHNVSEPVINAMLSAEAKKLDESRPVAVQVTASNYGAPRIGAMGVPMMNSGTNAAVQLPKVSLLSSGQSIPLQPSSTEIANSKGKGGSKAGGILKGFGQGMLQMGGMPGGGMGGSRGGGLPRVAYTWALPGRTSQFVMPNHTPIFEIEFSDIPGIDPDAYEPVIVKLTQTNDNWRLVESSKDKFDKHGNDTRSTKTEGQIATNITPLGRGHVRLSSTAELLPGEYGLVLHPKKDQLL